MNKFLILQVGLVLLGVVAVYGGDRLSSSALLNNGIALFGAAFLVGGMEAITTRQIGFARGWNRRESYRGFSAVFYGVIFSLAGAGLIGVAMVAHLGVGQALFRHFIQRPGLPLLTVGGLLLLWAGVVLAGLSESQPGSRRLVLLNRLLTQLLPGLILLVLGLVITGAGVVEILAPAAFDQMGGGFLELLFGVGK